MAKWSVVIDVPNDWTSSTVETVAYDVFSVEDDVTFVEVEPLGNPRQVETLPGI